MPPLRGEEIEISAAFRGFVDGSPPSFSDSDSLPGDDKGRDWCGDDEKSTGSLDNSEGIVDGDASDVENFRAQLKGLGDMVMLSGALYAEIDKSRFSVSFSSGDAVVLYNGDPGKCDTSRIQEGNQGNSQIIDP